MERNERVTIGLRLGALASRLCPFCIVARALPRSAYARKLAAMEANCPACRAQAKLKRIRSGQQAP